MPLTLVEMTAGDFALRRPVMVAAYAREITTTRGLTVPEAEAEAERDVAAQLPRGPATRHQLLRKAMTDGTEIGWIWLSLPGTVMPEIAWISDVEVDPPYRGQGHAATIITAAEVELAELGVPGLGLNVFGDNTTARRLYEKLGFHVTAQQYSRSLSDIPAADGVELTPITGYETRIEALFTEYAHDLVDEQGLWHGEAEARAATKLGELLPQGVRTAGMILRSVTADGVPVGWVWAGLPAPPRPGMGWLHHIGIDEPFRSQGYGRAAIAAVEAELAHHGVRAMGLNVHGLNTRARSLYERLGYRLLAQQMVKDLPAG